MKIKEFTNELTEEYDALQQRHTWLLKQLRSASGDSRLVTAILDDFQKEFSLDESHGEPVAYKHRFFFNFCVDFTSIEKHSEEELYQAFEEAIQIPLELQAAREDGKLWDLEISVEGYDLFVEEDEA